MILSHRYRFIFIKTTKTAGTSVEIALSRHCGPDDIVTPITAIDEPLRREMGGRGPQNHLGSDGTPLFYNHISARDVRELVDDDTWRTYFKFCIGRDPWERVVSLYYFRYQLEPRPALSEVIEKLAADLKWRGSDLYTIDGAVAVDRIVEYGRLAQELEEIRLSLGIPEALRLPRAKDGFRPDRRSYRELLTDAEIEMVGTVMSDEIDLLGYAPIPVDR